MSGESATRITPGNALRPEDIAQQVTEGSKASEDIAEYALLLAVILVIVISVVTAVGTNANTIFSKAAGKLNDANAATP